MFTFSVICEMQQHTHSLNHSQTSGQGNYCIDVGHSCTPTGRKYTVGVSSQKSNGMLQECSTYMNKPYAEYKLLYTHTLRQTNQ